MDAGFTFAIGVLRESIMGFAPPIVRPRMKGNPAQTYIISTTQRCGSTWVARLLQKVTGTQYLYVDTTCLGFDLYSPSDPLAVGRFSKVLAAQLGRRVFKTHDIPSKDFDAVCSEIDNVKLVTVRREFKDVLVSRYFYSRYYWPTEPALGPLPPELAAFFEETRDFDDAAAISLLISSPLLLEWNKQWRAF
jgi:Sulfotransferase domain